MSVMDIGRVCVKIAGKEAGQKVAIVEVVDQNYVVVTGPTVKRRRCNVKHLEATEKKLEITKDISDADVTKQLSASA